MNDDIVIVTRHEGMVEWLSRHGITGKVIPHATEDDVRGKVVIGNVPLHLAFLAQKVITVDMPFLVADKRGKDLTPEEMDDAGANLTEYVVFKIK